MIDASNSRRISGFPALAAILSLLLVNGCVTSGPAGAEFNDPYEAVNRNIHGFNKGVDRTLYRPVSTAYGTVVPKPVRMGVNNVSRNLGDPQNSVNALLQGRVENTVVSLFRFIINSTVGLAGVFDPATGLGLEKRDTDFGETLHVWGVGEGAYIAQPFFGPSTQRDTVGDVVDLFTDPFAPFLSYPEAVYPTAAWVLENADYRYEYNDSLNQVLYDSADSYAQSRLIYLENRRFELGEDAGAAYVDPYDDDAVREPGTSVIDPYEDF